MARQPLRDVRVLVGGVVVEDRGDDLAGGHCALDCLEEADELLVVVALQAVADHRPVEHVQRSGQRGCSVAHAVRGRVAGLWGPRAPMRAEPIARDSGTRHGRRPIRAGPSPSPSAALHGSPSCQPQQSNLARHLCPPHRPRQAPPKLALVALMRKILTTLNAMLRNTSPSTPMIKTVAEESL